MVTFFHLINGEVIKLHSNGSTPAPSNIGSYSFYFVRAGGSDIVIPTTSVVYIETKEA